MTKLEKLIRNELKQLGFVKKDGYYRYADIEIFDICSDDYATHLHFIDGKTDEHSHWSLSFCKEHSEKEVREMMLALTAMKGKYDNVSYIFFENELK